MLFAELTLVDSLGGLQASLSIVGMLFCSIFLKFSTLTELEQINSVLSVEQEAAFVYSNNALMIVLVICVLGALVISAAILLELIVNDAIRLRNEALAAKARRLVTVTKRGSEQLAEPTPLQGTEKYHIFLSHTWDQGQDEMRIIKQRLLEMMPGVCVFLVHHTEARTQD